MTAWVCGIQRVIADIGVEIERARYDNIADVGVLRDKGTDLAVVSS